MNPSVALASSERRWRLRPPSCPDAASGQLGVNGLVLVPYPVPHTPYPAPSSLAPEGHAEEAGTGVCSHDGGELADVELGACDLRVYGALELGG